MSQPNAMGVKPKLLYSDPKACTVATLTWERDGEPRSKEMFLSVDGHLFQDEHMARWSSCTHLVDEAGEEYEKMYTCGPTKRAQLAYDRWQKKEQVETFSDTPMFDDGSNFFMDNEALMEYCLEHEVAPSDMHLIVGTRIMLCSLDYDHWQDDLPEDVELPCEVKAAVKVVNAAVAAHNTGAYPHGWEGSETRPTDATIAELDAEYQKALAEQKAEEGAE